ncbi:MAG: HlyD family efflux transporter periplasmic adaptor subunit [Phycisphaerae bacterium]|nr:HlyD family efflux transporter periplasmic adaptor subunit [Phycisphaerae bacterium]
MKKILLAVVILVVLGGGYVWLSQQRLAFGALDAKFGKVTRGDLVIPIKASGKIQPKGRREIKSKASGEVIDMPFEVGRMVRKGDILVALKRDDEERNLDRAKASLDQAQIALDTARITEEERRLVGIPRAEAARDRMQAQFARVDAEYQFKKGLREQRPETISDLEWQTITATHKEVAAMVASAEADVRAAKSAAQLAVKDVERAQSALLTANRQYEDAKERLDETEVRSPIDGMVLQKLRAVGEVIQSGTQSLTGGTVLLELADVSEVYMVASVDEADIGQVRTMAPPEARPGADPSVTTQAAATQPMVEQNTIREDTEVAVTVEAFPDDKFVGVIERIAPETEVRQAVGTFEVRIRIISENREKIRNLVGMQAEAEFTSVSMQNSLLVPYEAVRRSSSDELGVFVPVQRPGQEGEVPEFRACTFGPDNSIHVVVLEGLEEGQRVYTKLPVKTDKEKEAEADGNEL